MFVARTRSYNGSIGKLIWISLVTILPLDQKEREMRLPGWHNKHKQLQFFPVFFSRNVQLTYYRVVETKP